MSPMVRRVAARTILIAGTAFIAVLLARSCERRTGEVTVVVDPGRFEGALVGLRVEVVRGDRSLGWAERRYHGADRTPVRLHLPRPDGGFGVVIELDTGAGVQRVEHPVGPVDPGATVRLFVGVDE